MPPAAPLPRLNIPDMLRQAGIRPSKGLGQNFLADDNLLSQIVDAAGVGPEDTVLEIGPGLGSLTRHLAQAAGKVTAVEIDRKLLPILARVTSSLENVTLLQGDILEQDISLLNLPPGYIVAANIPYYITSAVIRHLLGSSPKPARITLTVQLEVAQRICAQSGDLNLLALSILVYGIPRILLRIPSGAFYPAPQVDSAVVRIDLRPSPAVPAGDLEIYFKLVKAGFSQKRKTLRNSLSAAMDWPPARVEALLQAVSIDPMRRAETLSLEEWQQLVSAYRAGG